LYHLRIARSGALCVRGKQLPPSFGNIHQFLVFQIYSGQPDLHSGVEGGAVMEPMLDMSVVDIPKNANFRRILIISQGPITSNTHQRQAGSADTWFLFVITFIPFPSISHGAPIQTIACVRRLKKKNSYTSCCLTSLNDPHHLFRLDGASRP
jgi:hypothetical protein